jgi:nucleoside-diphosphate-sugar epimerase
MADLHCAIRDIMAIDYVAPGISPEFDQGDDIRFSDIAKIHQLGWSPKIGFYSGLKKTIEAYLER